MALHLIFTNVSNSTHALTNNLSLPNIVKEKEKNKEKRKNKYPLSLYRLNGERGFKISRRIRLRVPSIYNLVSLEVLQTIYPRMDLLGHAFLGEVDLV